MRKSVFTVFVIVVVLFMLSASLVSAGGGQVRGEKGQGSVNQTQIQDPPPFE